MAFFSFFDDNDPKTMDELIGITDMDHEALTTISKYNDCHGDQNEYTAVCRSMSLEVTERKIQKTLCNTQCGEHAAPLFSVFAASYATESLGKVLKELVPLVEDGIRNGFILHEQCTLVTCNGALVPHHTPSEVRCDDSERARIVVSVIQRFLLSWNQWRRILFVAACYGRGFLDVEKVSEEYISALSTPGLNLLEFLATDPELVMATGDDVLDGKEDPNSAWVLKLQSKISEWLDGLTSGQNQERGAGI